MYNSPENTSLNGWRSHWSQWFLSESRTSLTGVTNKNGIKGPRNDQSLLPPYHPFIQLQNQGSSASSSPRSGSSLLAVPYTSLLRSLRCFYGCGRFIRSSIRVLSGPCASIHCLTVAMTPDRRLSKAAKCGSARTGWIGSNPSACRMAELRAPLLSRFNRFQVDTRILTQKKGKTFYGLKRRW